jgi:hypothetical protein
MRVLVVMLSMLPACSAITLSDDSAKEHPVTKIVNMLKKMQTTLGEEQAKDDEINEKMACYCETNDKEKNSAVEAALRAIDELTVTIEEKSALASKLATEIEQLVAEMEAAAKAIATATKMREEEHAAFSAEEKELLETIAALTDALGVLGKHNEPALLSVAARLEARNFRHLEGVKRRVLSMLQQPNSKSYNARSGEIYGILKTMKEEFEGSLAKTQKEEAEAQQRFEELIAEKKAGIEKARERKNTKVTEKSDAEVALVNAKHDLKNVREGLSADQKFLVDLKLKCSSSEEEYAARSKERQEELVAVGEALTILTGDEARDLFGSTLGFLQVKSAALKRNDQKRSKVVAVLKRAATKSKSVQLSLLAQKAQLDAFVKVKAAIDEMLVELDQQQKDEVTHKRWCDGELRSNSVTTKEKEWEEEDLSKSINVLADTIETLDGDIAALQASIAEEKVQVKHASEDREAANKEFQQTVADQRATVVILNKVLKRLEAVYAPGAKDEKAKALLQRKAMVLFGAPEEPAGFGGDYKKQSSGGVLGLIEMTIADAERLQKETLAAEQVQQTDYEALVKDASAQIAADSEAITAKKGEKATAEVSKAEAEASYEGVTTELANLASYATALHASCDFVLKNFDVSQKARADEMVALEDAKAILSGADFK